MTISDHERKKNHSLTAFEGTRELVLQNAVPVMQSNGSTARRRNEVDRRLFEFAEQGGA